MHRPVRELKMTMDSEELSYWLALEQTDPLPDGYLQSGIVASTIANTMGGSKKKFTPSDFMPSRPKKRRPVADARIQRIRAQAIFAAHNARLKAQGKA